MNRLKHQQMAALIDTGLCGRGCCKGAAFDNNNRKRCSRPVVNKPLRDLCDALQHAKLYSHSLNLRRECALYTRMRVY